MHFDPSNPPIAPDAKVEVTLDHGTWSLLADALSDYIGVLQESHASDLDTDEATRDREVAILTEAYRAIWDANTDDPFPGVTE